MLSPLPLFEVLFVISVISSAAATDCNVTASSGICTDPRKSESTECPPWFIPATLRVNNDTLTIPCRCGETLHGLIHCMEAISSVSVLFGTCITFDEATNTTLAGLCPYTISRSNISSIFLTLPSSVEELNEFVCGPANRRGLLCSECQDGYYPAVYSYDFACARCSSGRYNWLKFLSLTILPITTVFLASMVFNVNINAPPLTVLILFSQIFSSPEIARIAPTSVRSITHSPGTLLFTQLIITCHDVWNLNFLRLLIAPFCLTGVTTTLHVVVLEYMIAFYPLVLVGVAFICIRLHGRNFRPLVILWKPFHRCFVKLRRTWDVNASVLNAFASFLLLSYWKIMYISFSLLKSTTLYMISGKSVGSYRWYYDAAKEIFQGPHIPAAILAIVIIGIIVVLPPVVLCLYPLKFSQKALRFLHIQGHNISAFMDLFQGYYRNRTEGGRDLRWVSSIYFLLRIGILAIRLTVTHGEVHLYLVPLCGVVTVLVAVLKPYKQQAYNYLDCLVLSLLTLFHHMVLIGYSERVLGTTIPTRLVLGIILSIALFLLLVYTAIALQWFAKKWQIHLKMKKLRENIHRKVVSRRRISRRQKASGSTDARVLGVEDLDSLFLQHNSADYQCLSDIVSDS